MIRFFPDLFLTRAKTTFGKVLPRYKEKHIFERLKNKGINFLNKKFGTNMVYKPLNYLDFDKKFLEDDFFKDLANEYLNNLEKRNIDNIGKPSQIYKLHKKNKNLSSLLINYISLEFILKNTDGRITK